MDYKSQCGQDKWVIENVFNGMTNGFFVDIGAGDGIVLSNTYVLEKELEWEGLCVEPHSSSFDKLMKNRGCIKDNSFIMDDKSTVNFTEYQDDDAKNCYFSTIYPDGSNHGKITVVKRKTISLFSLLTEKIFEVPTMIHYLSLDVEGCELDIIKGFFDKVNSNKSISKVTFLSISVEHNFKEPTRTNMRKMFEKNNYTFIKECMHDDLYVHKMIRGMVR